MTAPEAAGADSPAQFNHPPVQQVSVQDLIGSWHLTDYYTVDAQGRKDYPLGREPVGLIIYSADGYMSGLMMRAGREPFAQARDDAVGRTGTDAEARRAFDDVFGYAGAYAFDPQTHSVHHFLEVCTVPGWEGRTMVRAVLFDRQSASLMYVTPTRVHEDVEQRAYLSWSRVGTRGASG